MVPKILIVDDMPEAIAFLPEWLEREGFATIMATRGQQALALAEEMQPDVILLDVMMPGLDGIATCRHLRMNPTTADIPVILVSARSPVEARAEGLLAGASDYVTKPIHFPDLLERIEQLVRLRGDAAPDNQRWLEEMAYTALTMLPCGLAWVLVVDSNTLEHRAIAVEQGMDAARYFLSLVQGDQDMFNFPLERGDNLLADVVINRHVMFDVRVRDLPTRSGLYEAFSSLGLNYVSLMPLLTATRSVGVMVLGAESPIAESQRGQRFLQSLSRQAAMVIENARLLADLEGRDQQVRAEQAFRQMILDTMGEGLIAVDEEAHITYVNNRLLRLTDYTREDLYGQSVGMLFHPDNRDQLVNSLTGQRRGTLPFDQRLFTRNRRVMPVLLSRVVATTPDGKGQSTVIVVTDLSELQRNEDALRLQTFRLQSINRASNAISSARSFDEVVLISLESSLEVVQGVSGSLLLREPENARLVTVAGFGPLARSVNDQVGMADDNLVGWVATEAKSQLVTVAHASPLMRTQYRQLYGPDLRSLMAVPLVASDELVGVLEILDKQGGVFDEQDLETLESLAGSAAIAIENARLFDQMRRRLTELGTLLDSSAAVSSTLDFGDVLERIAHRLSLALGVERVVIADWHHQSNHLETLAEVVNAYWSLDDGPLRRIDSLPITCSVLESGMMMIATDVLVQGVSTQPVLEINQSGLRTIGGFPLRVGTDVFGVITLHIETPQYEFPPERVQAVQRAIHGWENSCVGDWWSRANLTDLSQRVLQAGGMRWCVVSCWDPKRNQIRLLSEVGRALWLGQPGRTWDVRQYPSLAAVLESGRAHTLQLQDLEHDPNERAYLTGIGGRTCLVAPLPVRGVPSGLVKLIDSNRESRGFDSAEVSLCQGIANVVGNAMENAQLYAIQEQRASALEAAYNELQDSDRIKDELMQNLSHELRTPLTHVLGYLRLIADQAFGPLTTEQNDALQLVVNKAQHLADIVKDMVAVQDLTLHNLDPKPVHLEQVVALAIRSAAGHAQARGITIVSRLPRDLPMVYADPGRIGEVFEELLENAIKFSPNDTRIEVSLEDPGGPMLVAHVRDFGIGIEPGEHERIFRRFYQVDSGTTRRFGGTGLGLAIVRRVIEQHSGRVWVDSQLGHGSCFHLTLPKASAINDD